MAPTQADSLLRVPTLRVRSAARLWWALLVAMASVSLAACGGAAEPAGSPSRVGAAPREAPWPHALLLPLIDGHIYRYSLETDAGQEPWLSKVTRDSDTAGAIHFPNGTRRFDYLPDGIRLDRQPVPVYVLRLPIVVGNHWPGADGSTVEIVAVDATATVPAGRFVGCVRTLEERRGDRPLRIATTFCPEVGIVELEVASGASVERATLESFGPPVEIGPDGELRPVQ